MLMVQIYESLLIRHSALLLFQVSPIKCEELIRLDLRQPAEEEDSC